MTVVEASKQTDDLNISVWAREAFEMGLESVNEQADWILEKHDWSDIDVSSRLAILRRWLVSNGPSRTSRKVGLGGEWVTALAGENGSGPAEPHFRLLADGARVWDIVWNVGGKPVATTDLSHNDVAHLKSVYRTKATELLAKFKWLDALDKLMTTHKVSKAGHLKSKGVTLPVIDMVEAGE